MNRLRILVWKEWVHLLHDPVGIRLMILPVLLQVFILGYAITTEVKNTPVTICDLSGSPQSRSLALGISKHRLFDFAGWSQNQRQVHDMLDEGRARAGVIIPKNFASHLEKNRADIMLIIDGQDANSSGVATGYLNAIISTWTRQFFRKKLTAGGIDIEQLYPVAVHTDVLFNPLLKATWYMVPALAVLLVTIVTALLTGFSIVRERESGTLEQLLVTPVRPLQLVVSKSIPYAVIGLAELTLVLILASLWFRIPFAGSYTTLFLFAILYLFSSIGIGILISTVTRTPHQALFITWFVLLFFILLSGFFLPIENMPQWVQQLTRANPVRYFMTAIREIMLKGTGIGSLGREALAMVIIGVLVYTTAVLSFRRKSR
ncbi:MAG: ABC transporter permease [Chitinispirillaceae bacterium]